MAEDSRIHVAPLAFGVERLVGLAMTPLQALLPEIEHLPVATKPAKAVRKPRVKKVVDMAFEVQPKPRAVKPRAVTAKSSAKAAHG